ncbi:hypothetical protein PVAG01_01927 [Phlyctema vagabunda]|uniref:DUF5672 domain-containing protein n=1 Tax=Phlyctema vagabunda TaxID=108571 RepID=A0ABR4PYJ9_9HELO
MAVGRYDSAGRDAIPVLLKNFIVAKATPLISLCLFSFALLWSVHHGVMGPTDPGLVHPVISSRPIVPMRQYLNQSKVALLIEDRPLPNLVPLFLHFTMVLPPDWTFRFIGSPASIAALTHAPAVQRQVASSKVGITAIPANTSIASQELISRFMTSLWLWDEVLAPADAVLVFQTDSILCANAHQRIDDFLGWDWIGAPWKNKRRLGGNGGLSLRRRPPIVEILQRETRAPDSEFEDVWLTKRLKQDGRRIADRPHALQWSGESQIPDDLVDGIAAALKHGQPDPRTGFEPMGFHIGNGGDQFHTNIWGTKELRDHVYAYCPEIKLTIPMDAAEYVPGDCQSSWEWGKDPKLDHPEKFARDLKMDFMPW